MNDNYEGRTSLFDESEQAEEVNSQPQPQKKEAKPQTSQQMMGDLAKLIDQGKITEDVSIDTDSGKYIFSMRTLNGRESTDVLNALALYSDLSEMSALRIECLSRSVEKINGTPVERIIGADGKTDFEKRKSIITSLQQQLLVKLYQEYEELAKRSAETLKMDEDDLKK